MKSLQARQGRHDRLEAAMRASPPSSSELQRAPVMVDPNCQSPFDFRRCVADRSATIVSHASKAVFFVASNPWGPDACIAWAARLLGGWIIAPGVYMQAATGPAVKLNCALRTVRRIWFSESFRAEFRALWVIILECMLACGGGCRWAVLDSAEQFATAKARAMHAGRSAEVLALTTPDEARVFSEEAPHVFDPPAFLSFIQSVDLSRTSLGLGDH